MESIRVAVARACIAVCLALTQGCTTSPAGEAPYGYPRHIELEFLDQGKRVFILEPRRYDLLTAGQIKASDFRLDAHRTVFVLIGTGRIYSADFEISIENGDIRVNGRSIGEGTLSAVLRPDGTVVRGASIRTAR